MAKRQIKRKYPKLVGSIERRREHESERNHQPLIDDRTVIFYDVDGFVVAVLDIT